MTTAKIGTTLVALDGETIEILRDSDAAEIVLVITRPEPPPMNGRAPFVVPKLGPREVRLRLNELDAWALVRTMDAARRTIASEAEDRA